MSELISVCLSACIVNQSLNLFVSLVVQVKAVSNVLTNRTGEKDWLLLDNRDLTVVPFRVQFPDVTSVEEDASFLRVVESLNQRDD